jgi:hypothetical protein
MSMKEPAMQLFQGLPALTRALPDLPDAAWIALPESLAQALRQASVAEDDPAGVDGDAELAGITQAFAAAGARLLVQAGDAPTRMGYQPWLPVAALRSEHPWPAGDDLQGADWQLRCSSRTGAMTTCRPPNGLRPQRSMNAWLPGRRPPAHGPGSMNARA